MDQVNQDGQGDHVDSVWNSDRMLEATMEKKVFEITTEMTEDEKMNVFISGFFERINPAIYQGRYGFQASDFYEINTLGISSVCLVFSTLNIVYKFGYCREFVRNQESVQCHLVDAGWLG